MLPKPVRQIDKDYLFDDERQPPFWTGTGTRKDLTLRPPHRILKPNMYFHMQQYVLQSSRLVAWIFCLVSEHGHVAREGESSSDRFCPSVAPPS